MSTQELVTSIVAEQEDSVSQFVDLLSQKIEDAIEVKKIELASQMFAESKGECPERGKAKGDCECEDEEEDDMEDDEEDDDEDEKEMKEEAEQIDELSKGKLVSYVKSAMKNKKPSEKRMQGISTASRRLTSMDEMADRVTVDKITTELGRGKGLPPKVTSKKIVVDKAALSKLGTVQEKAPPGAKYERMIKYIKKGYSKGGLTDKEKSIAYATAWKAKNREMSEAAMSDNQQMAALGMRGAEKAKTMTALAAYRKHGDINKLSAGHRTLVAGYMEKTGGLATVTRGTAAQALKKERMQEE